MQPRPTIHTHRLSSVPVSIDAVLSSISVLLAKILATPLSPAVIFDLADVDGGVEAVLEFIGFGDAFDVLRF